MISDSSEQAKRAVRIEFRSRSFSGASMATPLCAFLPSGSFLSPRRIPPPRRWSAGRIVSVGASAALLFGCGGPSPQDAENHVRSTLEENQGVQVKGVFCDEVSGDRYECEVTYSVLGTGEKFERTIVDGDDL